MPESPAPLFELVQAAVRARQPELVALVRQAVERELAVLVEHELQVRNGNGAVVHVDATAAPTRTCTGCARDLPLSRYEKGRGRCRDCRRDDAVRSRERRQSTPTSAQGPPSDDAEPRPAPAIVPAKRRSRVGRLPRSRYERARAEERREMIGQAPTELVVDAAGREWTLVKLPAQPFPAPVAGVESGL